MIKSNHTKFEIMNKIIQIREEGWWNNLEIAYVLIQCDLGSEENIIREIMEIPEAKEVRGTYGIYDVFCKVESDSKEVLDSVITNKIRKIPKIRSTITLHYIPSQGGK